MILKNDIITDKKHLKRVTRFFYYKTYINQEMVGIKTACANFERDDRPNVTYHNVGSFLSGHEKRPHVQYLLSSVYDVKHVMTAEYMRLHENRV